MSRIKDIAHSKPTLEAGDLLGVKKVLGSGMIAASHLVRDFEKSFCNYVGGRSARAAASGKDALILTLLVAGVKNGDEVILPTYICRSVLDAVEFIKARPVLVDVAGNYCIDPLEVKKHITRRTRAVVVAHMFGIPAPMTAIQKIVKGSGICVIEDCAHAVGKKITGENMGSLGDLSFFSFHGTKLLTTGEGGMLVVNTKRFQENLRKIDQGSQFFFMSDLEAALGLSQLRKLDGFIRKRDLLAKRYRERLAAVPQIHVPQAEKNTVFFRFPVQIKKDFKFARVRASMAKHGVQVRQGVDLMLHQVKRTGRYPCADRLFRETVSLPIYPLLRTSDVDYIVDRFKKVIKEQ